MAALQTTLTTAQRDTLSELTVQLYAPHRGQWRIHEALEKYRFVAADCGRRFGKTLAGDNEEIKHACKKPYSVNWWVAPSYRQAEIAFEQAARACYDLLKRKPHESKLRLTLKNDSIIEYRSADNYDNLRGEGPDFLVIDECRKVKKQAWEGVLRPAIIDHQSQVLFISTPQGKDWFYHLFLKGQDPKEPDYWSIKLPTSANPFIPRQEIEEARRTLPSRLFEQEFLAEFIDDAGVFRNVLGCVRGTFQQPLSDHLYILGWDVAKYQDFSVLTVMDVATRHVVAHMRLNHVEYPIQVAHVYALAQKYNGATVIMDSTGVGDPLYDMLRRLDLTVIGYYFTHASKNKLVDELVVAIEHGHVSYPDIPELINELEAFSYTITEARNIVYSAPEGLHDDCVFSLALALHGTGSGGEIGILGRMRAASERAVDEQIPRSWETRDEQLERRQLATAHTLRQIITGQGIVRTRWGQQGEGNRFEEDESDGEVGIV